MNEIRFQSVNPVLTAATVYAVIRNNAAQVWQTTSHSFVPWVDANIANYAIALVEQGTLSGYYVGDFPTSITVGGIYDLIAYSRIGGSPLISDTPIGEGSIQWTGTSESITSTEPVSLADMKIHLRYSSTDQDGLITTLISAARIYAETFCRRTFLASVNMQQVMDRFPRGWDWNSTGWYGAGYGNNTQGAAIHLKNPPVQSITSIKYIDSDDVLQTLDPSLYTIDLSNAYDARVIPSTLAGDWPGEKTASIAVVQVNYVSGFAPSGPFGGVPQTLQAAIKLLVGHWFQNREEGQDPKVSEIPMGAKQLLWSLRCRF